MRIFENFPPKSLCPICKTGDDKECTLIAIDGTSDGNICEAQPVHVECIQKLQFRINDNTIYTILEN